MMSQFNSNMIDTIKSIVAQGVNGYGGLPEEVFEFVSAVSPVPNVDLLIINERKEILLSWRNDQYYGEGWHIPGGCIRFGESIEERIHKTAWAELGCDVIYEKQPLTVADAIRGENQQLQNPCVRGHNVTILFRCKLKTDLDIVSEQKKIAGQDGFLKWFPEIPVDLLKIHFCYGDILKNNM